MGNFILCYHTGSGIIDRVVNADLISFEKCKLSPNETKLMATGSNPSQFLGKRYSGSLQQLANGSGSLVDLDEIKWYVNGQQVSQSMDVSIPSNSSFNLSLEVIDGKTNSKATSLSADGVSRAVSSRPYWIISSAIAPNDESDVFRYDSITSSLDYQPFTNGEATCSVDLTSDNNRVYFLRTGALACNLIKE